MARQPVFGDPLRYDLVTANRLTGINLDVDPSEVAPGQCMDIVNMDLQRPIGGIGPRGGSKVFGRFGPNAPAVEAEDFDAATTLTGTFRYVTIRLVGNAVQLSATSLAVAPAGEQVLVSGLTTGDFLFRTKTGPSDAFYLHPQCASYAGTSGDFIDRLPDARLIEPLLQSFTAELASSGLTGTFDYMAAYWSPGTGLAWHFGPIATQIAVAQAVEVTLPTLLSDGSAISDNLMRLLRRRPGNDADNYGLYMADDPPFSAGEILIDDDPDNALNDPVIGDVFQTVEPGGTLAGVLQFAIMRDNSQPNDTSLGFRLLEELTVPAASLVRISYLGSETVGVYRYDAGQNRFRFRGIATADTPYEETGSAANPDDLVYPQIPTLAVGAMVGPYAISGRYRYLQAMTVTIGSDSLPNTSAITTAVTAIGANGEYIALSNLLREAYLYRTMNGALGSEAEWQFYAHPSASPYLGTDGILDDTVGDASLPAQFGTAPTAAASAQPPSVGLTGTYRYLQTVERINDRTRRMVVAIGAVSDAVTVVNQAIIVTELIPGHKLYRTKSDSETRFYLHPSGNPIASTFLYDTIQDDALGDVLDDQSIPHIDPMGNVNWDNSAKVLGLKWWKRRDGVRRMLAIVRSGCVLPVITEHPANQLVELGGRAVFCVEVENAEGVTYQWRLNGTDIPGATASCYVIEVVEADDYGIYTVVVSNACGAVLSASGNGHLTEPDDCGTPDVIQLIVGSSPDAGPDDCIYEGSQVSLSADVSGTAPLSYQWQFLGVDIAGETGQTLVIPDFRTANEGEYNIVITNACGTDEQSVTLTMCVGDGPCVPATWCNDPPMLDLILEAGAPASLCVCANGTDLTYEWYRNGVLQVGENASCIIIDVVSEILHPGSWQVCVSNICSDLCATFTVTVNPPPPPPCLCTANTQHGSIRHSVLEGDICLPNTIVFLNSDLLDTATLAVCAGTLTCDPDLLGLVCTEPLGCQGSVYQWYRDGVSLGAGGIGYTLDVGPEEATYYCLITPPNCETRQSSSFSILDRSTVAPGPAKERILHVPEPIDSEENTCELYYRDVDRDDVWQRVPGGSFQLGKHWGWEIFKNHDEKEELEPDVGAVWIATGADAEDNIYWDGSGPWLRLTQPAIPLAITAADSGAATNPALLANSDYTYIFIARDMRHGLRSGMSAPLYVRTGGTYGNTTREVDITFPSGLVTETLRIDIYRSAGLHVEPMPIDNVGGTGRPQYIGTASLDTLVANVFTDDVSDEARQLEIVTSVITGAPPTCADVIAFNNRLWWYRGTHASSRPPTRAWWSDGGRYYPNVDPISYEDVAADTGAEGMRLFIGYDRLYALTDRKPYRMEGDSPPFVFVPVGGEDATGCIAPKTVVPFREGVFFLSASGPATTIGDQVPTLVGSPIRHWFTLNQHRRMLDETSEFSRHRRRVRFSFTNRSNVDASYFFQVQFVIVNTGVPDIIITSQAYGDRISWASGIPMVAGTGVFIGKGQQRAFIIDPNNFRDTSQGGLRPGVFYGVQWRYIRVGAATWSAWADLPDWSSVQPLMGDGFDWNARWETFAVHHDQRREIWLFCKSLTSPHVDVVWVWHYDLGEDGQQVWSRHLAPASSAEMGREITLTLDDEQDLGDRTPWLLVGDHNGNVWSYDHPDPRDRDNRAGLGSADTSILAATYDQVLNVLTLDVSRPATTDPNLNFETDQVIHSGLLFDTGVNWWLAGSIVVVRDTSSQTYTGIIGLIPYEQQIDFNDPRLIPYPFDIVGPVPGGVSASTGNLVFAVTTDGPNWVVRGLADATLTDYYMEVRVRHTGTGSTSGQEARIPFRITSLIGLANTYLWLSLTTTQTRFRGLFGGAAVAGDNTLVHSAGISTSWVRVGVEVVGRRLRVFYDGELVFDDDDIIPATFTSGGLGIGAHYAAATDSPVHWSNLQFGRLPGMEVLHWVEGRNPPRGETLEVAILGKDARFLTAWQNGRNSKYMKQCRMLAGSVNSAIGDLRIGVAGWDAADSYLIEKWLQWHRTTRDIRARGRSQSFRVPALVRGRYLHLLGGSIEADAWRLFEFTAGVVADYALEARKE